MDRCINCGRQIKSKYTYCKQCKNKISYKQRKSIYEQEPVKEPEHDTKKDVSLIDKKSFKKLINKVEYALEDFYYYLFSGKRKNWLEKGIERYSKEIAFYTEDEVLALRFRDTALKEIETLRNKSYKQIREKFNYILELEKNKLSKEKDEIRIKGEEIKRIEEEKRKREEERKRLEDENKKMALLEKLEKETEKLCGTWNKFVGEKDYLTKSLELKFITKINSLIRECKLIYLYNPNQNFEKRLTKYKSSYEELDCKVSNYNIKFIEEMKKKNDWLFKKSPFELDDEQKTAVITDDDYNLVIAAAGSGKTETLTTKIAYLAKGESIKIEPERILALAFQRGAKKEIEKRLEERYGLNIEVRTFHSLGNKILEDSGKKFTLKFSGDSENKYYGYIREVFAEKASEPKFLRKVLEYTRKYEEDFETKTEADFKTKQEYYQSMREKKHVALNGTLVRSEAEKEIMDFFIMYKLNGKKIDVGYEEPAEWMSYKNKKGIEKIPNPDFYLKDYDIYIENWGIDKKGNVPIWFEDSYEKYKKTNADYKKGMKIKRNEFKKHEKSLVEMYSYEFKDYNKFINLLKKRVLAELSKKYHEQIFSFELIEFNELVKKVWSEFQARTNGLPQEVANFIRIAKTYDYTPQQIQRKLSSKQYSEKKKEFTEIALTIFNEYQKKLKEKNEIDFCDMINLAIKELNSQKDLYENKFDRILIDEYQDISFQRYNLIQSLMKKNSNCRLFAVGDDWQSIMGFTGSDLKYFLNFESYFTDPKKMYISTNYRSTKAIVNTGNSIIKGNGNSQINKKVVASHEEGIKPIVYCLKHKKKYKRQYYEQMAEDCMDRILEYQKNDPSLTLDDVMILARIKPITAPLTKAIQESAKKRNIPISSNTKKPNVVKFLSVHKSKGLQSKIVFILDLIEDLYGFPCQLQDLEVMELARKDKPKNREEEERRLFYVATTRAIEQCIMYTNSNSKSKFLEEIRDCLNFQDIYYGDYSNNSSKENELESLSDKEQTTLF